MNKFTKIILGTGLAVATLGAVAAPATAAPASTDVSVAAQGDRLEGPSMLTYGGNSWGFGAFIEGQQAPGAPAANPASWNVPAFGTTGEIRMGDLCLTYPVNAIHLSVIKAEKCDGSARQQFIVDAAGGLLTTDTTAEARAIVQSSSTGGLITGHGASPVLGLDASRLTPVAPAVVPVDITGATTDTRPVFSGSGDVGATVEITLDDGTVVGSTTVGTDGKWTIPSTIDIADGSTHFTATQTATDNSVTTDDITVTILGTPVIDPLIAGGSALALLAVAGGVLVKRRQTAGAAA